MLQPVHSLSSGQAYRQLIRQARAPRAANGDLAVTHRIHFYVGSTLVRCLVQNLKDQSWTEANNLSVNDLTDSAKLKESLQTILTVIGISMDRCAVVVHLAHPFHTNQMVDIAGSSTPRSVLLAYQPQKAILENISSMVSTHTWIEAPFAKTPVAPRCERRLFDGLAQAASELSPSGLYSLTVLSAPLEAIGAAIASARLDKATQPSMMWIYYDSFSVLAGIVPGGDCIGISRIDHAAEMLPRNIAKSVNETALNWGLIKPQIIIVRCGSLPTQAALNALTNSLSAIAPTFSTESADILESPSGSPALPYETTLWQPTLIPADFPQEKVRFALQSFYVLSPDQQEAIVPPNFAKMASVLHHSRWLFWFGVVAILGWFGFTAFAAIQSEEWNGSEERVSQAQAELTKLTQNLNDLRTFSQRFAPRSSALVTFHLLPRLFPDNSGVTVNRVEFTQRFQGDQLSRGTARSTNASADALGWEWIWTVRGRATTVGAEHLQTLGDGATVRTKIVDSLQSCQLPSDEQMNVVSSVNFSEERPLGQNPPLPGAITTREFQLVLTVQTSAKSPLAVPVGK